MLATGQASVLTDFCCTCGRRVSPRPEQSPPSQLARIGIAGEITDQNELRNALESCNSIEGGNSLVRHPIAKIHPPLKEISRRNFRWHHVEIERKVFHSGMIKHNVSNVCKCFESARNFLLAAAFRRPYVLLAARRVQAFGECWQPMQSREKWR